MSYCGGYFLRGFRIFSRNYKKSSKWSHTLIIFCIVQCVMAPCPECSRGSIWGKVSVQGLICIYCHTPSTETDNSCITICISNSTTNCCIDVIGISQLHGYYFCFVRGRAFGYAARPPLELDFKKEHNPQCIPLLLALQHHSSSDSLLRPKCHS